MSTSPSDFDGSVEIVYDHDAHNALLIDPGTPVELRRRGRRRCLALARVGLSVVAVSGLCLLPASSLADDAPAAPAPIVVTADCQITSALDKDAPLSELPDGSAAGAFEKGTPSGVLGDGRICVAPPAPQPEPAKDPEPAAQPAPETPAPEAPAVEAPAANAEPQVESQVQAEPPAPLAEEPAAPAAAPAAPVARREGPAAEVSPARHVNAGRTTAKHETHKAHHRKHAHKKAADEPAPVESSLAG